ncbi:MAG: ammonium transporter [Candidatus Omnitrophica bacterium]|nr:ammonium transporter [Candidatus Omnitrophota bacterium]MBU2251778.1 ammonium transporter [Candidatus Omnitrophota bacterium]
MNSLESSLQQLFSGSNVLFLLLGAMFVFSMHAGFAFLEVGSVRRKNQVNALVKIIVDWGFSTIVYFTIGFPIAYGISFFKSASELLGSNQGFDLVHFFFLLAFAACIPAIISGGIAERAKFWTQSLAGGILVGFAYPFFESLVWGRNPLFGQAGCWLSQFTGGIAFHDYAGSVVVHSIGGWLALPAIILLGARLKRYSNGQSQVIRVSNIPFLALGSWLLCIGWFGFNVMSAGTLENISGLVALNSLMAMVGGIVTALVISKNDVTFIHNGALAGLIAVCAGSDLMHPIGALITGGVAAAIFVILFQFETEKLKIDDVLGVWPLHGVAGTWGGFACGIFGQKIFGGMGGVSFLAQTIGSLAAIIFALISAGILYGILKYTVGLRLSNHEEIIGADLSIHRIEAYPEESL